MFERNVGGLDRAARALLAAGLSVLAVDALATGRAVTGLLAVLGALGAGFNATVGWCGVNRALGLDTTGEESGE